VNLIPEVLFTNAIVPIPPLSKDGYAQDAELYIPRLLRSVVVRLQLK